jgi:hypothetical protein
MALTLTFDGLVLTSGGLALSLDGEAPVVVPSPVRRGVEGGMGVIPAMRAVSVLPAPQILGVVPAGIMRSIIEASEP